MLNLEHLNFINNPCDQGQYSNKISTLISINQLNLIIISILLDYTYIYIVIHKFPSNLPNSKLIIKLNSRLLCERLWIPINTTKPRVRWRLLNATNSFPNSTVTLKTRPKCNLPHTITPSDFLLSLQISQLVPNATTRRVTCSDVIIYN